MVWGAFGGGFADPSTPKGARLAALPMDEGTPLYHLRDAVETDAALGVDPERKTLHVIRKDPGDGTVTRSSALMDERVGGEWAPKLVSPVNWDQVMFFFRDHLGITKDAVFTDNLLYLLLEQPPRRR